MKGEGMKKLLLIGLAFTVATCYGIGHTCKINLMKNFFQKDGIYKIKIWDNKAKVLKNKAKREFTLKVGSYAANGVLEEDGKNAKIKYTTDEAIVEEVKQELANGGNPLEWGVLPGEEITSKTLKIRESATIKVDVAGWCMRMIRIESTEGALEEQIVEKKISSESRPCKSHSWNVDLNEEGEIIIKNNY